MSEINLGDVFGVLAVSGLSIICGLILGIAALVAECKLFSKAGYDWWAAIIPIYNLYVLFQIIYGSDKGWKFLLLLIPLAGEVVGLVACFRLAQQFNRSFIFCILNVIITPITLLIMAFGDAEYMGSYNGML